MTLDEHMEGFEGIYGDVNALIGGEFKKGVAKTETVSTVAVMQLRARSLFSDMIGGKIEGYRVEMDRSVHPAKFHITTWK